MIQEITNIYTLNCPNTGLVRYVGKTNNPNIRLAAHLYKNTFGKKRSWILGLKKEGKKPTLNIIDEVPYCDWQFWEEHYIKLFKSCGANLFNLTLGGVGCRGNDYVKSKMSQSKIGKFVSEETRSKMSKLHLGKKRDILTRIKNSRRQNGKPVYQYDKNGNFVKKWEFANMVNIGIINQNIYACLKGLQQSAGGFFWSYENLENYIPKYKSKKKICQYDLSGNFIAEFETIVSASSKFNLYPSAIYAVCKGVRKTSGGFIWKYKID